MKYPPCKGCTARTVTCHGTCEKYTAWKQEHEAITEKIRAQKQKEDDATLFCVESPKRHRNNAKRRRCQ